MITSLAKKVFGSRNDRLLKQYRKSVVRINGMEKDIQQLDDAALQAKTAEFKQRLAKGETLDDILEEAFAVCRAILMCSSSAAWCCTRAKSPKCAPARAKPW